MQRYPAGPEDPVWPPMAPAAARSSGIVLTGTLLR